jgi:exopolysaccharide production protein ExoZ
MVQKQELPGIQILRGVAALAVVVHHTLDEALAGRAGPVSPDWLITLCAAGVDVFFVISGLIMLYVSFGGATQPPPPKRFLVRRLSRVFPLYWVCVAAILLLRSIGLFSSADISPLALLLAVTLLPGHSLVYVAWTLTFELYFYAIFAMTLVARSKPVAICGSIAAIIAIMIGAGALPASTARTFLTHPIALEFCFGMMVTWLFMRRQRFRFPLVLIVTGSSLLVLTSIFIEAPNTGGLGPWHRTLAWGIPAALIVAGCCSVAIKDGSATKLAVLLGDASYSIYLSHIFVMIVYARLLKSTVLGNVHQGAIISAVVFGSAIVGVAVHIAIEKPIIAFFRRRRAAATTVSPQSVAAP